MEYLTLDGLIAVGKSFRILIVESPLDFPVITNDDHMTLLFIPRCYRLADKGRVLGECIRSLVTHGKVYAA